MAKGKPAKKRKPTAPKAAQPKRERRTGAAAARDRFVKGVITRGEAARPDASGKLPDHATHVVVDEQDGTCTVKRARFKLY
jgi:hypothetical protein